MQELSMNVLDIVQNSVSAKADLIYVTISEQVKTDKLIIEIIDNGVGMSEEQVNAVTNPFYTTRTTRKVGLGIPFFKMAAEMTGGELKIISEKEKGTEVKATFGYSHIDRMPLGNMEDTLIALISLNPDIDFVYTHKYDEKEFVIDTRDIKVVLSGLAINTPEVITFIREMYRENLSEIKN